MSTTKDTTSTKDETNSKESPMYGLLSGKKTFVGYLTAYIVDEDGISRKTKGHSSIASVRHVISTEKGKERKFIAELCPNNPLNYVSVMNRSDYLKIGWAAGKFSSTIHPGNALARATISCNKIEEECDANENEEFHGQAAISFIADRFNSERQADLKIGTKSIRFNRRITTLELTMPEELFKEWLDYFVAMLEWDKKEDVPEGSNSTTANSENKTTGSEATVGEGSGTNTSGGDGGCVNVVDQ